MGFWAVFYGDYGKASITNPTSSSTKNATHHARISVIHAKWRSLESDVRLKKQNIAATNSAPNAKPRSAQCKYQNVNVAFLDGIVGEIYAHKRQAIAKIKRESPVNMQKGIGKYKKTSAIIAIFSKENL